MPFGVSLFAFWKQMGHRALADRQEVKGTVLLAALSGD